GSGRAAAEEPDPPRAVPVHLRARLGVRFRRLPHRPRAGDDGGRLWRPARGAETPPGGVPARRDAPAHGHRRPLLPPEPPPPRPAPHSAPPGAALPGPRGIRPRRPAPAVPRPGTQSQGQGPEPTSAQIIATELRLPADNITVEEGNTDTAPYGLGTYGSRST